MTRAVAAFRTVGRIGKRIYAFLLVAMLLYVFYLAVTYLVAMVFYPTPVPPRFVESPAQLPASALRKAEVPGLTEPTARAPFAHYHQITQWFLPDRTNGCTLAGCHEPLPHSKIVYVRSFTNFHATFLTCGMCHDQPEVGKPAAGWVSTQTGLQTRPPALVQLERLLDTRRDEIEKDPAAVEQPIISLLQEIILITNDPLLRYLQLEIATAEPGSPVWRDSIVRLTGELPLESRGQYGEKVARLTSPNEYLGRSEELRRQAKIYFAAAPESPERKRIQDQIHAKVLAKPDRCLTCHGGGPAVLDFEKLGYSPQRATFLQTNPIAAQVQSVREGREFYLPRISEENP